METSHEPISVRIARINSEITSKNSKFPKSDLISREALLDALQVLYDECNNEQLKKFDHNISTFVEKHKSTIKDIKQLRVNISDFEIKNVIGRGHFGEVHVVREKQTGDIYAMKTLRKFDKESQLSYEAERNIMAFSVSHWHTSLQYAFQDNSHLFYVMDYHPGGDLLGLLYRQGGTLPESATTFYLAELVLALEDLHGMGYVHRDIKPDNVLLDRCGHIKLADFGSAAMLNEQGVVKEGPPVGTPDYIAPEVLQSLEGKNKDVGYGISCDFWSLGVLAYELVIGTTPFTGPSTTSIYSKIVNHSKSLKFPSDITLSQGFISFIKSLITDQNSRLAPNQVKHHPIFKNTRFESIKDEVPPFVPKITSLHDTSNFSDIQTKQKQLTIDNFRRKTQFSGRNLPFIGFTFTHDPLSDATYERKKLMKDETVQNLKAELEDLRKKVIKGEDFLKVKEGMEKKLEESRRKLEATETVRNKLERDIANHLSEATALRRTLELERKDRVEIERKAMDLIKGAKLKWEAAEKAKLEAMSQEMEEKQQKIIELINSNDLLNKQLQHALNVGHKHKESLEKVTHLNRRSVIGLESRLDQITCETQSTIMELKSKLGEKEREKESLEKRIVEMQEDEIKLKRKLDMVEGSYAKLKGNVDEAENVIKQLVEKVNVLEEDVGVVEGLKGEISSLKRTVEEQLKTIKDLENKNILLKSTSDDLEQCKKEIDKLNGELAKARNDKKVEELERELKEEREKLSGLKKELETKSNNLTDNQELKELRTKFWRMEKDFANCKLDKRILERELKDSQNELKSLTDKLDQLNKTQSETKAQHEAAMLELNNINEAISMELVKVKESFKNAQYKLDNEKEKAHGEKTLINELRNIIKAKDDKIDALRMEIVSLKNAKEEVEALRVKIESDKDQVEGIMEQLKKEREQDRNQKEKMRVELENKNLNLEALREACTLLESQVVEFEKIVASLEKKQCSLNEQVEKLIGEVGEAKKEVQEAKRQTNEEKSYRLLAETKVKRLTEDVECLTNESSSYKQQCNEYKQYSASLSDELTVCEEKITDLEVTVKSYDRQVDDLMAQNGMLKEEISECITELTHYKECNYKLNHQVNELKDRKKCLEAKLLELEGVLTEKSAYYKERELKFDATINQHVKLIDYLQSKVEEHSQKKKTFTDKLFGSSKKENQPPLLVKNYKDLEALLVKEQKRNRELQEELYKVKAEGTLRDVDKVTSKIERHKSEIVSPRTRVVLEKIENSPKLEENGSSVQRMKHNIPHRFESRLCKKSVKCFQCHNQIMVGRNMNSCKECTITVHPNCAPATPKTCGLPAGFAQHYKNSLTKLNPANPGRKLSFEEAASLEGWVKVPGKTGWEKKYACLTEKYFKVYSNLPEEKDSQLLEAFELKPEDSHGKVILEPSPAEINVKVANSDLPFILKLEVASANSSKSLIFMTLSTEEKGKWIEALQKVYYEDLEKLKMPLVLSIPEGLQINCLLDLTDNIRIYGTQKGLYSQYNENFVHIEGPSEVHSISVLNGCNMVIMIVNSKRHLITCDFNHLVNITQCSQSSKPTLKYSNIKVNNLCGFQILKASDVKVHQKICAATLKQLLILEFDDEDNEFKVVRCLDTAKPTSCILFTENSLIVGADKFFEIDLATMLAEEFLDVSDPNLRQAEKCYQMSSYPIAILCISKNPKEFLLCFKEFSVFVDEYGRSTRASEMKSVHPPSAIHYAAPYLYLVQSGGVEIVKISEETCNSELKQGSSISLTTVDSFRVDLGKNELLGIGKKGIYVCVENDIKFVSGFKLSDDANSSMGETTEDESDRFSFTSSMVQSLDGHLSDNESVDVERQRRVKFCNTDL